jgi:hypothetical protein
MNLLFHSGTVPDRRPARIVKHMGMKLMPFFVRRRPSRLNPILSYAATAFGEELTVMAASLGRRRRQIARAFSTRAPATPLPRALGVTKRSEMWLASRTATTPTMRPASRATRAKRSFSSRLRSASGRMKAMNVVTPFREKRGAKSRMKTRRMSLLAAGNSPPFILPQLIRLCLSLMENRRLLFERFDISSVLSDTAQVNYSSVAGFPLPGPPKLKPSERAMRWTVTL